LVTLLRVFTRKPIIYNALCSEYERKVISRTLRQKRYPMLVYHIYYWLIDWLACACANLIMLESRHQIDWFCAVFFMPVRKYWLARTGADDTKFACDRTLKKFETFTALFRGRLLPEAGGDVAVQAAKLLEGRGIKVLMLASGMELPMVQRLIDELQPDNLTLRTEFIPDDELLTTMQRCHVSLGQLSRHDRLQRTIPHKAYESLALGLPYLTARNPAVLELLQEGETCLTCNPSDPEDLAEKILWAKEHPREIAQIGENGHLLFQEQLTPQKLAGNLLAHIRRIGLI